MSDPLSISASIAGLISLSTVIYQTLSKFVDKVDKAPKSVQDILYAVAEMRLALISMSELVDKFSRISARRKAMVQLDHLVISLSRAVMTFTDLELFLGDWPEISSMQSSAWKRIRWAMRDDKAAHLIQRLSENRMALIFILSILQSESDFEAHTSSQALTEQMDRIMAENREMRILVDQIGSDIQTIVGSAYVQDNASTMGSLIVPGSPANIITAFQPEDGRSNPTSDSADQSFNRAKGEQHALETQLLAPAAAAETSMARFTSRPSYTSPCPSRRSFSIVLNSSWVYKRVKAYSLDLSLNSSKLQDRAWSMFSGVSLNDVSVTSFIRLPLRLPDIPHDAVYWPIPGTISPDLKSLEADEPFIIAVVGESMSGVSLLVNKICEDKCGNEFSYSKNSTIELRRRIESRYEGRQYQVDMIDTAGLDCFQPLIDQAIAESHAVIIACPAIDADMGVLSRLYQQTKVRRSFANTQHITPVVIAVTKHNLVMDRSDESRLLQAQAFAEENGIDVCLTSAEDNVGISNAFTSILGSLVKNTIGTSSDELG